MQNSVMWLERYALTCLKGFMCFRAKRRIGLEWLDTTLTAVTSRKLAMIGKKTISIMLYFWFCRIELSLIFFAAIP